VPRGRSKSSHPASHVAIRLVIVGPHGLLMLVNPLYLRPLSAPLHSALPLRGTTHLGFVPTEHGSQ